MTRSRIGNAVGAVRRLIRERRASVVILVAGMFPLILGMGLLGVDGSRLYFQKLLLRQTAQAASMAGANKLSTYYTSGTNSTTDIVNAAQQFAGYNMPSAAYGTVVPAANVTLGNWNLVDKAFIPLSGPGGTPDAVKVVANLSSAGGNPFMPLFGGSFGVGAKNLTSTAISSFATGKPFHVIVVNDLSSSFSSSITNQRTADQAILNCVYNSAGATSEYGLVGFNGQYTTIQTPVVVSTNYTALTNKITTIKACTQPGGPPCSGSNVASGIYRATKSDMFGNAAYADTNMNIVVITDGVPNASGSIASPGYGMENGTYPTPSSATPVCSGYSCTDANLLTMAQNQANYAWSKGINISTIYYSGNTPSAQRAAYAASLATLRKGTGISLVVPTQTQINNSFAAFCATMSSKLMALY